LPRRGSCLRRGGSGLALNRPEPPETKLSPGGDVHRRDRLGGLVHEYYRTAA
jgi:hypothetical protein